MSKRAIARLFGISRDSVDKSIVYSVPPHPAHRAGEAAEAGRIH